MLQREVGGVLRDVLRPDMIEAAGFVESGGTARYIGGTVVFDPPVRGDVLRAISGATVSLSQPSGWTMTLSNAWMMTAEDGPRRNEYVVQLIEGA